MHGHHVLPGQLLAQDVFQAQLLGTTVEEVAAAGILVAVGDDQHELFIAGHGAQGQFLVRKLLLQQFVIRRPVLVLPVDLGALVLVDGGEQFVRELGEDGRAEIHTAFWIGFQFFFLARGGVEEHQFRQVPCTLVCFHVDPLAVLVEVQGIGGFEHAACVDLGEPL